jgi:RNA polymerase sigma-70 factor (ECF subfamily)
MDEDPSDEELMASVGSGNREAYDRLYSRWRRPVFAFLVRRTGTRAAADDAFQDTWLRVYRSRATFDPRRKFKPWLFAIAAHAGIDAVTRDPLLLELAPEADEPENLRDLLSGALEALSPEDRRLLLLGAEGFDSREIGKMLDLQPGTVRVRLHRARQRVRAALGVPDA